MEDLYGIKELYDLSIRAVNEEKIQDKIFKPNEILLHLDTVQIGVLTESVNRRYAQGGYNNKRLVTWENTPEIRFNFTKGVVSKIGLALLANSRLIQNVESLVNIPFNEEVESNENGEIQLKYIPLDNKTLFIYNNDTGELIEDYTIEENKIIINDKFLNTIVNYEFNYKNKSQTLLVGSKLITGYVSLDAKTRLKDDTDGHIKTGIIRIPRVKLMSDLSISLGEKAHPMVSNFSVTGHPVGVRGNEYVCEIIFLDNEIDSDIS